MLIESNRQLLEVLQTGPDVTEAVFPVSDQLFETHVVLYGTHLIASVNPCKSLRSAAITNGSKRPSTQHNDMLRHLGFSERRLSKKEKDGMTYYSKLLSEAEAQRLRAVKEKGL